MITHNRNIFDQIFWCIKKKRLLLFCHKFPSNLQRNLKEKSKKGNNSAKIKITTLGILRLYFNFKAVGLTGETIPQTNRHKKICNFLSEPFLDNFFLSVCLCAKRISFLPPLILSQLLFQFTESLFLNRKDTITLKTKLEKLEKTFFRWSHEEWCAKV